MPLWPDPRTLDWPRLAAPLARAEDGLARLDERLKTSPIRAGFLARPLVTAASLAETLRIAHRDALDLIAELDLRETTGRGRYRAWAVLRP